VNREEAVQILESGPAGVLEWNRWRMRGEKLPDLSGIDLSNARLCSGRPGADQFIPKTSPIVFYGPDLVEGANLELVKLRGANLTGTDLRNANFTRADLQGASLCQAEVFRCLFDFTNLQASLFREAEIDGSIFIRDACLLDADFSGAICSGVSFSDVDLSGAIGLETAQHRGPSSISIDTLVRSRGKIPEVFLRGCGLPDAWIANIPDLIGALEPIQFYSCFISYNNKDEGFAKRLHSRMDQEKLRVWFAPKNIQGGKKIHEQVDLAIRIYDKLLLVLSEHSMTSRWVQTEVRKARSLEVREGKRKLFPISLVPFERMREWESFYSDLGEDVAEEIRQYFIPDFSAWKDHDAFEAAFARLLADLKADVAKPTPSA
jgi:hypothetical protein